MASSVAVVSLSVLVFAVYEALEFGPLVTQLRACSPCHVFHRRHWVALSELLLGVYKVLESGPLISLVV